VKREGTPRGAPRNQSHVEDWGATRRGLAFEDHFWVPALRERFGRRLKFAGRAQRTFTLGWLSATPDGLITGLSRDTLAHLGVPDLGPSKSLVVECKTSTRAPRSRVRSWSTSSRRKPSSESFTHAPSIGPTSR
jgi:hypothetical protein